MHGLVSSLVFTILQAFVSAAISLFLGGVGAFGLVSLGGEKVQKLMRSLAFAPNALPVLFVILATFNFFNYIGGVWLGFGGIVLIHVILNSGLVALSLADTLRNRLGGVLELALVEGASSRRILGPVVTMLTSELKTLFFFVFSFCFMSFSVPLIVGGGFYRTIEVYIYEQIKIYGHFLEASYLSIMQLCILILFSLFFLPKRSGRLAYSRNLSLVAWPPGLAVVIVPALILLVGLTGPSLNHHWAKEIPLVIGDVLSVIPFTLMNGLFVALGTYSLFSLMIYFYPCNLGRRILYSVAAPSFVLVGFLLFIIEGRSEIVSILKISLGLCLLFLPALYKLFLSGEMGSLKNQYEVSKISGAKRKQIFHQILFPQMRERIILASQVSGLWAVGDFALSSMIATDSITLPLVIKDLMSSYRLDLATSLCWLLLGCGTLLFMFTGVLFRVIGARSS